MLEFFEQNIVSLEKIQVLIRGGESLTCNDLMLEIDIDHLNGHETLLPILLLSSGDAVIERVSNRLYLQLFGEKMGEIGGYQMVERVKSILFEEQKRAEERRTRLKELKLQNKL